MGVGLVIFGFITIDVRCVLFTYSAMYRLEVDETVMVLVGTVRWYSTVPWRLVL